MQNSLHKLVLLSIVAIAGCQGTPPKPPPPDEVTAGSTLTVKTPFTIPAGQSGVYFQDNQLQKRADLDTGFPYCHFALGKATPNALTVGPQSFMVKNIEFDEDADSAKGGYSSITRLNLMYGNLSSAPTIRCRLPGGADSRRFVTPAEIVGAMGAYFDLKIPQ